MNAGSGRVKRRTQPHHAGGFYRHHIKAAGWWRVEAHQKVPCRKNNAPLFGKTDAGRRAAMATAAAFSDLYKHQGAVRIPHDQVNFTAATPRRSIIALKQVHASFLQVLQCYSFRSVSRLLGTGCSRFCC
jgi:hypothetical protein